MTDIAVVESKLQLPMVINEKDYLSLKGDSRLVRCTYILKRDSSDVTAEGGPSTAFKNDS